MAEVDAALSPLDDQGPLSQECGQHGQHGEGHWPPGQSGDTWDIQDLEEGHNSCLFVVCQSLNIWVKALNSLIGEQE